MAYAANSPFTWLDWTPVFAGFSSAPTSVTFRYQVIGKTVFFRVYMTDATTSNATTMTMTMPIAGKTGVSQTILCTIINSGTGATTPGRVIVNSGSNVAGCFRDTVSATWTNTGDKRIFAIGFYEID